MDYLLRDAYFTGTEYGTFDLTRILRVIRPYKDGLAYAMNGMHAVEDYIVSRLSNVCSSLFPSGFKRNGSYFRSFASSGKRIICGAARGLSA